MHNLKQLYPELLGIGWEMGMVGAGSVGGTC